MNLFFKILGLLLLTSLLAACASKPPVYTDPTAVDTTSISFGSSDLQTTAKKMVDGLLTFPPIVQLTNKQRPILFVDRIRNQTDEHLNTKNISDMMMTELLQSGKFQFIDPAVINQVRQQLAYQRDSGLVDPTTAVKVGKQIGAQYMLYGTISNITQRNSDITSVYFLITMKLLNLQTGFIEWADQKQIRKIQKRATFGW